MKAYRVVYTVLGKTYHIDYATSWEARENSRDIESYDGITDVGVTTVDVDFVSDTKVPVIHLARKTVWDHLKESN